MHADVDFVACDMSSANRMTCISWLQSPKGALPISERANAGLAALKSAIVGRAVGVETLKRNRSEAYMHVGPTIAELRTEGLSFAANRETG
jgi:hypothetical protein